VRARRPNRKDVSLACYRNKVIVSVGSRSDGGKEFLSLGAQAAKLCGPKRTAERWTKITLIVSENYFSTSG